MKHKHKHRLLDVMSRGPKGSQHHGQRPMTVTRPKGLLNNQKETKNKKNLKNFFVSLCFFAHVFVSRDPEGARGIRGFMIPRGPQKP
jgi:hypothetical protein